MTSGARRGTNGWDSKTGQWSSPGMSDITRTSASVVSDESRLFFLGIGSDSLSDEEGLSPFRPFQERLLLFSSSDRAPSDSSDGTFWSISKAMVTVKFLFILWFDIVLTNSVRDNDSCYSNQIATSVAGKIYSGKATLCVVTIATQLQH